MFVEREIPTLQKKNFNGAKRNVVTKRNFNGAKRKKFRMKAKRNETVNVVTKLERNVNQKLPIAFYSLVRF